jgi:regulatory protein
VPGRPTVPPSASARAAARLSLRDHSEHELRQVLARKGHAAAEIDAVVERLLRERGLDDARMAERFASVRLTRRGHGTRRIRQDLLKRGIARPLVERGLKLALADTPEAEGLDTTAQRYWISHARVAPEQRLKRLWAFLLRRGFPEPLVRQRLRELWPTWRDALEGLEAADEH